MRYDIAFVIAGVLAVLSNKWGSFRIGKPHRPTPKSGKQADQLWHHCLVWRDQGPQTERQDEYQERSPNASSMVPMPLLSHHSKESARLMEYQPGDHKIWECKDKEHSVAEQHSVVGEHR